MKITAITKYKHGGLYRMLQKLGWSQSELARRTKMSQATIGAFANLVRRPSQDQANVIQLAFGEAGEYFDVLSEWPETFRGLPKGYKAEQTADIDVEHLLDCQEALQLAAPAQNDNPDLDIEIKEAFKVLTEKERYVLTERFLNGRPRTEIAQQLGLACPQSVAAAEEHALRKLRGPRSKRILLGKRTIEQIFGSGNKSSTI